jgi:acyl-coenzyme A thioesterase PaaI-like protein
VGSSASPSASPVLFLPGHSPVADAERWTPTEHTRGPWNPDHCHGGPPSALLARACERVSDERSDPTVEWQLSRLTVELTRAVPVGQPLDVISRVVRPGRKVSLVEAELRHGDVEVARARALRIRHQSIPLPGHARLPDDFVGEPGDGEVIESTWSLDTSEIAFHRSSCEHRFVEGSWDSTGPCKVWIRLLVDLVPGESPTGVQRAVTAADFGNGVSSAIDPETATYINPDLTVHIARPPRGEWIGLASHSVYGTATESSGAGFAESSLHDEAGRFGRSVQSLLIQPG